MSKPTHLKNSGLGSHALTRRHTLRTLNVSDAWCVTTRYQQLAAWEPPLDF